jgi:Family of unknown function (DUF6289)
MSSIRKLTLVGILAGIGFLGAIAAYALPSHETETYYYSDPARTIEVGWRILLCNGNTGSYGTITRYTIKTSHPCY